MATGARSRRLRPSVGNKKRRRPSNRRRQRSVWSERLLRRNAVHALLVVVAEGLDFEAQLFGEHPADEAPYRMRLPAGGLHDLAERRALGSPHQFENLGLLAALARLFAALLGSGGLLGRGGLLLRPLGLRRVRGALWRNGRRQGLRRLPDAGQGRLAVFELLDRGDARQAVPEFDQLGAAAPARTGYRPRGGQLRQLLLASQVFGSGDAGGLGVLERREHSDVVVAIDGECRHFVNLLGR